MNEKIKLQIRTEVEVSDEVQAKINKMKEISENFDKQREMEIVLIENKLTAHVIFDTYLYSGQCDISCDYYDTKGATFANDFEEIIYDDLIQELNTTLHERIETKMASLEIVSSRMKELKSQMKIFKTLLDEVCTELNINKIEFLEQIGLE